MTTDTKRLKEFATKCAGIELYGCLEHDSKTWTLRDHEGEVFELRRRDQRTLHLAEYVMLAKPLAVRDLIYQNEDLFEKVKTLTTERDHEKLMCDAAIANNRELRDLLELETPGEMLNEAVAKLLANHNNGITQLKALALAIWTRRFKVQSPHFEPFDHLTGLAGQVDNMAAGLMNDIERGERMLLSACTQLGQIGEALGLSMDDDADTMLGTIAANAQALRCNQEATKILAASNKALFDDLEVAAKTLRRYEALHRDKCTEDSLKKAEVNAELASRFEATIAQAGKSQGLDIPDFTPGNGNRARRRAAALGIEYPAQGQEQ